MKPEIKYETNIATAPLADRRMDTTACFEYSSAICSESRLPIPMENDSTKIKIVPVIRISDLPRPATATPETSPSVDARLSSTPKTKFLRINTEGFLKLMFFVFILPQTGGK